jgi:hypothetical protein
LHCPLRLETAEVEVSGLRSACEELEARRRTEMQALIKKKDQDLKAAYQGWVSESNEKVISFLFTTLIDLVPHTKCFEPIVAYQGWVSKSNEKVRLLISSIVMGMLVSSSSPQLYGLSLLPSL